MKKIEIWTFKTCPFCIKAINLLESLDVEYENHVLAWGDTKVKELEAKSGIDTLPQLFVDGEFIGDSSKMMALHQQGELVAILKG
jgi:glutaredoxin 3